MARANVFIEGYRETIAALEALAGEEFVKVAVEPLFLMAAKLFADEARSRAPIAPRPTWSKTRFIQPGNLRRSIHYDLLKRRTYPGAYAAVDAKIAPHRHLVEGGTKPHSYATKIAGIFTKRGKIMRFEGKEGTAFTTRVDHPGAKAKDFFWPSVKDRKDEAVKIIEDGLRSVFEQLGAEVVGLTPSIGSTPRETFTGPRGGTYYFAPGSGAKVYIPRPRTITP